MTDKQDDFNKQLESPPEKTKRPWLRGVMNGVIFTALLCLVQVYGIFEDAKPLTDDDLARYGLTGVIFGYAIYVVELWKRKRTLTAESAAKASVEKRLDEMGKDKRDD